MKTGFGFRSDTVTSALAKGVLGFFLLSLLSCNSTTLNEAQSIQFSNPPSYSELNQKIFQAKCLSCHNSGDPNFTSYETLIGGSKIISGNATGSILYQQISSGFMPKDGSPLSQAEINAVSDWIANGAQNSNPTLPPDAITNLSALSTSQTSITLTWTLPAQTVSGVLIERSTSSSGTFATIASLSESTSNYIDSGLSAETTYFYRVSVSNSGGASPLSTVVSTTTLAYPPNDPTNLAATAISSNQINLSWTDNSSDETGFILERSLTSTGTFTEVSAIAANATSNSDSNLNSTTTYYYRLSAIKNTVSSAYSNVASATTQTAITTVPANPSGLTANGVSSQQINLSWTDNASTETGYKVESSTNLNGTYTVIATLAANSAAYSDSGLTSSSTYSYKVYAYNSIGNSGVITANATTQAPPTTIPTAPSGLAATAASSSQINLVWTDNSSDESGFKIERSTSSGSGYSLLATVLSNTTSYQNTSLTSATTYYYRIYAYNGAGNSTMSSSASATTQAAVPTAPSGLTASSISSSQIDLSWNDNANNETNYKVQRATSVSGPFSDIATLAANTTTYSDTGRAAVTSYYYKVYAANGGGNSNSSSIASATTWGTFNWINANVFQPNCVNCHSGNNPSGNYDLTTYSNTKSNSRVIDGDATGSLLYQKVQSGSMPKGSAKLSATQLEAIRTWINSGAPNN